PPPRAPPPPYTTLFRSLSSTPQRLALNATVAPGKTAAQLKIIFKTDSAQSARSFYVDGAQIEQNPFPTPFILTDGVGNGFCSIRSEEHTSELQSQSNLV